MSNLEHRSDQTPIAPAPLPERLRLSLSRQWGCVALFVSHFEVVYEGEQATFHCHTQAHVRYLPPFRHELPLAEFAALWHALQASEPAHWAAEYGQEQGAWSTGALSGTLSLDYTLDGRQVSRTVRFLEQEFDGDEQMRRLYTHLVAFEKARLELEARESEATS